MPVCSVLNTPWLCFRDALISLEIYPYVPFYKETITTAFFHHFTSDKITRRFAKHVVYFYGLLMINYTFFFYSTFIYLSQDYDLKQGLELIQNWLFIKKAYFVFFYCLQ